MEFPFPEYDLQLMLPEIFLFVWALVVITFDLVTQRAKESTIGYLAMLGLIVTAILVVVTGHGHGFGNMFVTDSMSQFFKIIFLGTAFMAIGSSFEVLRQKITHHRGEFFGLILFSTLGMMFLASSNELLSLYIGLELTTIPLFVLAGFYKDNRLSVEASIKYFVVGAFSSALLLYGLSFLYGLTGTTDIVQMQMNLALVHVSFKNVGVILVLTVVLLLAGIGFKLGLPPFHQWVPDVYEGSPTPVAAFLSVGSKAAGLVAFVKIFVGGMIVFHGPEMSPNDWGQLTAVLAALAMVIGNTVAIRQTNIKRMLGYSSIAQGGYIMIGMVSGSVLGVAASSFYMFVYLFANMGAFAVVAILEDKTGSSDIKSYAGLSKSSPGLSLIMAIFLLSLAGIPPLAGFLAKYYVFAAAIEQAAVAHGSGWLYWLVGVGLLTSVFSLYYYANVIKQMYFSPDASPYAVRLSVPVTVVLAIGLIGVLLFGIYPEPLLSLATDASSVFSYPIP